jgi:hypothetical protein
MYHYVRPHAEGLPYFPYLSVADFERQLEIFEHAYGFVYRDEFLRWAEGGPAPEGVLLTFDDGLRDHAEFVLPALRDRGLFALFYVPSGPATTGRILDVHKVHLVLGKLGGTDVLAWLQDNTPSLVIADQGNNIALTHYAAQNADQATKFVKYLFNWKLSEAEKGEVLDALLDHAFASNPPQWQEIYLDERALRAFSCAFVEQYGGSRGWGYCYPFGAPSAFSPETEEIVAQAGCPLAFAVEANDIASPLALAKRYALPRHDCNAFPHGEVSYA